MGIQGPDLTQVPAPCQFLYVQVVQQGFGRANMDPADSLVVTSPFTPTTPGQAPSCVVLVCGSSSSHQTLDLGAGAVSWRTREAGAWWGG